MGTLCENGCSCLVAEEKDCLSCQAVGTTEPCHWQWQERHREPYRLLTLRNVIDLLFLAFICKEKGGMTLCQSVNRGENEGVSSEIAGLSVY